MVQNYRYINEWTIKNNCPLPLISEIVENIGTENIFMKMDLQWSYNNVQIKEGDKWKVAFITSEGSFKLTVIFFGLMNTLTIFQIIINRSFRISSILER